MCWLLWLASLLTTTQAQSQPNSCVSSTDLLVWLPLGQTQGTQAPDLSGHNHHGTVSGGLWEATNHPHPARALFLSGPDQLVVPLATPLTPTAFTIAFWVRPTRLTNWNCFLGARLAGGYPGHPWGGFVFLTTTQGHVAVGINHQSANGYLVTDPGVMTTGWQHFVFTYDTNRTGTLYRDGVQVGASMPNMPVPQSWHALVVGNQPHDANLPFDGSLADLRLYRRALDATEARELAQCTNAGTPAVCQVPTLRVSPPTTTHAGRATTLWAQPTRAALAFDGVADQVVVRRPGATTPALLSNVVNSFTVEAWVKPTTTHEVDDPAHDRGTGGGQGQRYLIFPTHGDAWGVNANHAGMGLSVGTNGVSVYEHGAGYVAPMLVWEAPPTSPLRREWTHVAVVYQNRRPTLFINGVEQAQGQGLPSPRAYVHPSAGFGGGYYGHYQGLADELRIWNVPRTAAQLLATAQHHLTAQPGLVGCWHLDEGQGLTVADASGQDLSGTLSRTAQWRLASTAPVSPPTLTYTWSPTTGLNRPDGPTVQASPPTTTPYTVTATGAAGCPAVTATVLVTVRPAPPQLPLPTAPCDDLTRNWTVERTYDGEDHVIAESKQFTDGLGRPTQAQARNVANKHVFATQTVYNSGGQPVLQTLAAPINNQAFCYKEGFVQATAPPPGGGAAVPADYGPQHFEGTRADAPTPVDNTDCGTLGYYFSARNELEPLTPTTAYPFSLSEPNNGPLGGTKRAAAPGDAFRMGAGHEAQGRELPLLQEFDHYQTLRPHFVPGSPMGTLQRQGTKSVSVDGEGRERVVVVNKEGQALVSCRTGAEYPPTAVSGLISTEPTQNATGSAPPFLDIHIPATGEHPLTLTLSGTVRIKRLSAGPGVSLTAGSAYQDSVDVTLSDPTPTSAYLLPGFYRLSSRPSATPAHQTQRFAYSAEYGEFSYTYYDVAGRAVATVAPKGLPGANWVQNPSFDLDADPITQAPIQRWQTNGNPNGNPAAVHTEAYGGAHSGAFHGTHFAGTSYYAFTHQVVTDLPAGIYTLQAWVKSSGGQRTANLLARDFGGSLLHTPIGPTSNAPTGEWVRVQVPNIVVSNGQCDIGLESDADAGQFLYFDDVVLARQPDATAPQFVTRNSYDTSNRLLSTESPDEGRSEFIYARDGRLRFSQSALQKDAGRYSYSNYDELGRVVESGECTGTGGAPLFANHLQTPAAGNVLDENVLESRVRTGGGVYPAEQRLVRPALGRHPRQPGHR